MSETSSSKNDSEATNTSDKQTESSEKHSQPEEERDHVGKFVIVAKVAQKKDWKSHKSECNFKPPTAEKIKEPVE